MSDENEDSGEKSHEPTQGRLEKARENGQIAQSADVTTAAAYAGVTLAALVIGGSALTSLGGTLVGMLDRAPEISGSLFAGSAAPVLGPWVGRIAVEIAPWFAIPAALAVLALLAQQAPAFAPSKLAFKLSRLSPLSNARNKFGLDGLVEFLKSSTKLGILGVLLGVYLSQNLQTIIALAAMSPQIAVAEMGALLLGLLVRVAIVAAILAAADYFWQRLSFLRRNRMTRKEVIDEMKEREGDPAMKQQRRARAVAIATTPLRKAVAEADVVIVNPTHYAVALGWARDSGRAPVCLAKGVDEMAATIRALAAEHGIPIQSDPPAARALFAEVAVGQEIDRRHYRAVAAAIRFAERIRTRRPL